MSEFEQIKHLIDTALIESLNDRPSMPLTLDNLEQWRALPLGPWWFEQDQKAMAVKMSLGFASSRTGGPDVPLRVYQPPGISAVASCILHIHGGAFVGRESAEWEAF